MLSEITPLNQESTSSKQSSAPKDNLNKFQIVSYTTKLAALTVQLNATSTSYNYPTEKNLPQKGEGIWMTQQWFKVINIRHIPDRQS